MSALNQHYAIIGGGITGLAAALQLERQLPSARITLIEASDRLGGVLRTEQTQGYLIEQSADMFSSESGVMLDLCRDMGVEQDLIQTQSAGRRAFVARGDRLHPVPAGFSMMLPNRIDSIVESEILDQDGRIRMLAERWVPPRNEDTDESFQSFAVRRFGQQAFDRLIQPLISGIYSADPEQLSMRAALSRFVDMEREHGSLMQAARSAQSASSSEESSSGARYGMFLAMKDGMQSLVDCMADQMQRTEVVLNCAATGLHPNESGGWCIKSNTSSPEVLEHYDGVVLTTRADVAGKMLQEVDRNLSCQLAEIEYASMAIVVLGVDSRQIPRAPHCFGFVVPEIENRNLVACSFASHKFSGRAPDGKVLVRCFIGGSLHGDRVAFEDRQLIAMARKDLADLIGLEGDPEYQQVVRWQNCMPQYVVGHLERVAEVERGLAAHSSIELAGNSYHGVGIPVCVASGQRAAVRLVGRADSTNE